MVGAHRSFKGDEITGPIFRPLTSSIRARTTRPSDANVGSLQISLIMVSEIQRNTKRASKHGEHV